MLASSFNDLLQAIYSTLNFLIVVVNKYAKNQDYALKKRRIKSFKKDIIIKTAIVYDAHKKIIFTSGTHRNIFIK